MRAVVQRVSRAAVSIDGREHSSIKAGLCVLLGITTSDTDSDIQYIIDKLVNLRVFPDEEGKLNLSLLETAGALMIVSQFTLYGDARKGRRPSYSRAAGGDKAHQLYTKFLTSLSTIHPGLEVATGVFGAMMQVSLVNDGPVTILLDSEKVF
jgi:D-tyrosyl-tRNA(Tyr) deacylase